MPIINERIAGVLVSVPDSLAGPKSRAAIAHGVKQRKERDRAFAERDVADNLRHQARELAAQRAGALLDEGGEYVDQGDLVKRAQEDLDRCQRELDGRIEAERLAAVKIREAVAEELPLLGRAAVVDVDTALAMLAAVLEDAEAAREALWSSLGVGHMVARLVEEPGAPIAIQHKAGGYTFDLEAAIELLQGALTKAADELSGLKVTLKPSKRDKPRKARKSVSEAQGAAPTASAADAAPTAAPEATPVAPAVDIVIGGDDDADE